MTQRKTFLLIYGLLVLVGCNREREARVPGAELQVEAVRLAVSKLKTPEDVVPYDDALVWHEYQVKKVRHGTCESPKIRVAHWSVAGGKAVPVEAELGQKVTLSLRPYEENPGLEDVAQSDDLDVTEDLPRFLDLEQTLQVETTPEALRMDYSGFFSEQMTLYWELRAQLRLVAMGNSLVTKGVATRMFHLPENSGTPVALNLAPAGANNAMQCLVVREYVMPLPRLEWVVWGVSPRQFNARREDPRKLEEFLASPGRSFDEENKATLWPLEGRPPTVTVEALRKLGVSNFDMWGWEGRKKGELPELNEPDKLNAYVEKMFGSVNFEWSGERWQEFVATIKALNARGVKVLLLTTPIYPMSKDMPAADPDLTPHEAMADMVKRLEALDKELPLSWFHDYNQGGRHDFGHDEFYDADHLNRSGSFKLTERLVKWLAACEAEAAKGKGG